MKLKSKVLSGVLTEPLTSLKKYLELTNHQEEKLIFENQ
jgi:hypothetical protein